MEKKSKFKVGQEVICRVDGNFAYIILPFKAAVVNLGRALRVIPLENLVVDDLFRTKLDKDTRVRVIPTEKEPIFGTIVDVKWFYVVHFHKTGELKIAFTEVLADAKTKIIPYTPLTQLRPIPDLPGQGKIFKGGVGG